MIVAEVEPFDGAQVKLDQSLILCGDVCLIVEALFVFSNSRHLWHDEGDVVSFAHFF